MSIRTTGTTLLMELCLPRGPNHRPVPSTVCSSYCMAEHVIYPSQLPQDFGVNEYRMTEFYLQCRICRFLVARDNHLFPQSGNQYDVCDSSALWYIKDECMPDWVSDCIIKDAWQKGKLHCPKCNGRLGSFNFIKILTCSECQGHKCPPVHILKNRVDKKSVQITKIVGELSSEHQQGSKLEERSAIVINHSNQVIRDDCSSIIDQSVCEITTNIDLSDRTNVKENCAVSVLNSHEADSITTREKRCIESKSVDKNMLSSRTEPSEAINMSDNFCDLLLNCDRLDQLYQNDCHLSKVPNNDRDVGKNDCHLSKVPNNDGKLFEQCASHLSNRENLMLETEQIVAEKAEIGSENVPHHTKELDHKFIGETDRIVKNDTHVDSVINFTCFSSKPEVDGTTDGDLDLHHLLGDDRASSTDPERYNCAGEDFHISSDNADKQDTLITCCDKTEAEGSTKIKVCKHFTGNSLDSRDGHDYQTVAEDRISAPVNIDANCDIIPDVSCVENVFSDNERDSFLSDRSAENEVGSFLSERSVENEVNSLLSAMCNRSSDNEANNLVSVFQNDLANQEGNSLLSALYDSCDDDEGDVFQSILQPQQENSNNQYSNIDFIDNNRLSSHLHFMVVDADSRDMGPHEEFIEQTLEESGSAPLNDMFDHIGSAYMEQTLEESGSAPLNDMFDRVGSANHSNIEQTFTDIYFPSPADEISDDLDTNYNEISDDLDTNYNIDVDESVSVDFLNTSDRRGRKKRRRGRRERKEKKLVTVQKDNDNVIYEPWLIDFPEEHICPVCFDLFCEPHAIRPCSHVMCEACLRRVGQINVYNTPCPMCRQQIIECIKETDLIKSLREWYPDEYRARLKEQRHYLHKKFSPLPQRNTYFDHSPDEIRNRIMGNRNIIRQPRVKIFLTGFLLLVMVVPTVSLGKAVVSCTMGLVHDIMTWF